MTELDVEYVNQAISLGQLGTNCLEVGTAEDWCCLKPILKKNDISVTGIDIKPGNYVDHIIDLEESLQRIKSTLKGKFPFDSILCLNVLEHTFNPITILDNLCGLLKPRGYLLISTPLMWPLHSYPYDFWRPLPNFYEQYAKRNNLELPKDRFKYLGFGLVENYTTHSCTTGFPSPVINKLRFNWGKIIHRLFNTFGRNYLYPNHLALGLTYQLKARSVKI